MINSPRNLVLMWRRHQKEFSLTQMNGQEHIIKQIFKNRGIDIREDSEIELDNSSSFFLRLRFTKIFFHKKQVECFDISEIIRIFAM